MQHPHAAGIDVGSRSHWVCVGFTTDAASCLIQEFPAHTDGLKAIAAFLREHQVTTVALESTGIYWKPVYYVLEDMFPVWVINAEHLRNVPGRKTDVADSMWIAQLIEHGLRPPELN